MNTWKTHIKSGNEHFRNEAYGLAEQAYIHACERSEKLFHHWFDTEEIVAAITVSYFNLADCLKYQGRYNAAQKVLEKAYQIISLNLNEVNINSGRYLALMRGRNKTQVELQHLIKIIATMGNTDGAGERSLSVSC